LTRTKREVLLFYIRLKTAKRVVFQALVGLISLALVLSAIAYTAAPAQRYVALAAEVHVKRRGGN